MQPQLWMAAIDLTKAASGVDPSFPAFWLPFQDAKAHNHIAQWVVQLVGPPPMGDGGTCVPDGVSLHRRRRQSVATASAAAAAPRGCIP